MRAGQSLGYPEIQQRRPSVHAQRHLATDPRHVLNLHLGRVTPVDQHVIAPMDRKLCQQLANAPSRSCQLMRSQPSECRLTLHCKRHSDPTPRPTYVSRGPSEGCHFQCILTIPHHLDGLRSALILH